MLNVKQEIDKHQFFPSLFDSITKRTRDYRFSIADPLIPTPKHKKLFQLKI